MTSEKDLDLLDQYVGNRMSAHDKAAFEQKLAADSELLGEYRLQQKIVEGVRKARAAELKKMLNDIPVANLPTDGTPFLAQVGIWVAVAGLVGTGAYFYFSGDETPTQPSSPVSAVVEPDQEPANTTPVIEDTSDPVAHETDDVAATREQKPSTTPAEVVVPTVKKPVDEVKVQPVIPAPLDVFDPTEEMNDSEGTPAVAEEGETVETTAPSIVVETASDKRYSFHYQFKNDKLYLYGSFEKNLYEIMEFFSDNKRTMFLFYKENYYLLNEESERVKALAPITDGALLKKLKDYRGN